jgi:hypothetical protein
MNVVYSLQEIPNKAPEHQSIFLAGPTPRDDNVSSWRPEALEILQKIGFKGSVFVPEDKSGKFHGNYDHQVQWEHDALEQATVIVFWIPRSEKLPGFTTNDEWGYWKNSGKVVLGVPKESQHKCKYQMWYAEKLKVKFSETLEETLVNAICLASLL